MSLVLFDLALAGLANYLGFWLRFDGDIPPAGIETFRSGLPWVLMVRGVGFSAFGLYGRPRRRPGGRELGAILLAVASTTCALYVLDAILFGPRGAPRTIYVIDSALLVLALVSVRSLRAVAGTAQADRKPRLIVSDRASSPDPIAGSGTRAISIEALLARSPIAHDGEPIRRLIANRRVMVTGAGGSIGAELCRQIHAAGPAALVLYERSENHLYQIHTELQDRGGGPVVHPVLGDVRDGDRLDSVMRADPPGIVFHAAGHKHVPLMELNPCEAVRNNVAGTWTLARAADRHGVERFVMVSTDKAVNPVGIMGASKRAAELVVELMSRQSRTRFATVRFGNVLGSNGSVLPRFLRQVDAGGPVTVTHQEVSRYFMSIGEAVQFVLQAAALSGSGAVYVLDMGAQVKVLDLARKVIRLRGLRPDLDIPIAFVGLRPGEKLHEEFVGPDEIAEPSGVDRIVQLRPRRPVSIDCLAGSLSTLVQHAERHDLAGVLDSLHELIPSLAPAEGGRSPARLHG